jgi:hypothetical protein
LAAGEGAGFLQPQHYRESGEDVYRLSSLQTRHPNGFRRGAERREADAAGRTTGRPRRRRGETIRGAGGKVLESEFAPKVVATVHPSSLLRQPDEESRERKYKLFVSDLRVAVKAAK